jgi:hypothetical protein
MRYNNSPSCLRLWPLCKSDQEGKQDNFSVIALS